MTRKSILKRKDYLSLLSKSKSKKRRDALIDLADKNEIQALAEIFLNTIRGNVPLTNAQLKRLEKYKKVLRKLSEKQCSVKKKKKILKQQGGLLPFLLPLAFSALSGLFGPGR